MDTRVPSLAVLAKMALMDGVVEPAERAFLEEVVSTSNVDTTVDQLFDLAATQTLEELIEKVDKYEDRFFIALRAYLVAHSDQHYDVEEEAFFNNLVEVLGINDDDRAHIEQAEKNLQLEEPPEPDPHILELYYNSSFFIAEE